MHGHVDAAQQSMQHTRKQLTESSPPPCISSCISSFQNIVIAISTIAVHALPVMIAQCLSWQLSLLLADALLRLPLLGLGSEMTSVLGCREHSWQKSTGQV